MSFSYSKKFALISAVSAAVVAVAAPASATTLVSGTTGTAFSAFDITTQGTLLNSVTKTDTTLTFTGTFTEAVYRNSLGTLDFYFQFTKTGGGSVGDSNVKHMTGFAFGGFSVDAMQYSLDPDGAATLFGADTNPGTAATASRSVNGNVIGVDFAIDNPVSTGQTSATYIFRTNALDYTVGTFAVIDGSTMDGISFAPSAAVPEPATWAMFIGGFGLTGAALRRKKAIVRYI